MYVESCFIIPIPLICSAGTGLLSMIAARAMPTNSDSKGSVFACESYLPMFKLMRKLVRCNSLDKNIKIINKRSDELIIGLDIPAQADILVSHNPVSSSD